MLTDFLFFMQPFDKFCYGIGLLGLTTGVLTTGLWVYSSVVPTNTSVQEGSIVPNCLEVKLIYQDDGRQDEVFLLVDDVRYLVRDAHGMPVLSLYEVDPPE